MCVGEPNGFDHYLEDFEEDEIQDNELAVDNRAAEENVGDIEVVGDAEAENENNTGIHIDNAWVDVDIGNIMPGRTRGARQDYRQMISDSS